MSGRLRVEYENRVAAETTLTGNRVPILQRKFGVSLKSQEASSELSCDVL